MSDSEYNSEESYEFEFEDDASEENEFMQVEEDENLQNQYYTAKAFKDEDTKVALEKLSQIAKLPVNQDNAIFIYKSTKQMAKIHFLVHNLDLCLEHLVKLLPVVKEIDDPNYLDESLTKILLHYGNVKDDQFRLRLYEFILSFISMTGSRPGNDRIWIKCNLNKFSLLLKQLHLQECTNMIKMLNEKLNSVSEVTRLSYSLEVIASEIELLSLNKSFDIPRLSTLYEKSMTIASPVTHPRIMGIIKECGGKLEFFKGHFEKSRSNFYDSFKNFDECGSLEKDITFKYLILLSLITENEFNPFQSQETQHYSQQAEFQKLLVMIECFNELDLVAYKQCLEDLGDDEFFRLDIFKKSCQLIQDLIVEKKLLEIFKCYSQIDFSTVEDILMVSTDQLEQLLLQMGCNGKLTNISVDFSKKLILSVNSNTGKMPPTLDAQQILTNMRCSGKLCRLVPEADDMNIDELENNQVPETTADLYSSSDSKQYFPVVNDLVFLNKLGAPSILESIDQWFEILQNCYPKPFKLELTTKDQIFTEQRLGQINPDIMAQLQNNQSQTFDPHEKVKRLEVWCKELIEGLQ